MFLNWLWQLLLDQRGEQDGQDAPPSGDAGGQGDASPDGGQPSGDAGQGDTPPAKPKYGDFGDSPTVDDIFTAFNQQKAEFDNFRKKAGLTEGNLGKLRQTLESAGIVIGEDGKLRSKEGTGEKKTRFTDTHKALFDPRVLEAMQFFIEDMLDNRLTTFSERTRQQQTYDRIYSESVERMFQLYPTLRKNVNGKTNPEFNQVFFDRANEILQQRYARLPNGDLVAAHEAAIELGISPIAVEKAKVEGFNQGQQSKRVLGPVKSSGQQAAKVAGRLSKEEYLKLSPEEKAEYDKKTMDKVVPK